MRWDVCAIGGVLFLTACAGPEPILQSNRQLQLYGRAAAQEQIESCGRKVESAGIKHGTTRMGNAGASAVLGAIIGGGVGASAGLIGGPAGVAIGAAAGGGLGVIVGTLAGAYKPVTPDQAYKDAMAKCLKQSGYDVMDWE